MVVRVVFGGLAVLFAGGFILFGIGSESGSGGLFDGLFGDSGNSSTSEQYEQQVEDAEKKLESDPENERALTDLIQYLSLSGQSQVEVDEATQQPIVSEGARGEFERVITTWQDYLATSPDKVAAATASSVVNAYRSLGDTEGAADAQEVLAEGEPSITNYATLALLRYYDLDLKAGDAAKELALEDAKPQNAKQIETQLGALRKQVVKFKEDQEKLPDSEGQGGEALDNPFGGLSPQTGGLTPAP